MELRIFYVHFGLFFLFCVTNCNGARILGIFPIMAKSHFTCNNAIMRSLIDSGHEVTVFTSFAEQAAQENYTSIIKVFDAQHDYIGKFRFDEFITQDPFKFMDLLKEAEREFCSKILSSPEIQKIFNSDEKLYDVLFVEVLLFHKCYFPIAEKMKIPIIGTVTLRNWWFADLAIHNPNHPAYIPFELVTQNWKLDRIAGRIMNTYNYIASLWYQNFVIPKVTNEIHDNTNINQSLRHSILDKEPDLILYNNHPSLFPRPMNPNAIDIGGIHMKEAKPLPQRIQQFIDEADHGVILFSLGSVVRAATLSVDYQKAFRNAFAEIPQRVIWKFEEKIENLPSNVMLLDWLPQRDILEHENVIAFISHCGLGGVNEAVYTATPVIACPLFCDQPDNAELLENLEVAVHLNIYDITKENVLNALKAIINDTKYYNNMQKLSKQFKDRPMTAQQSVVYWTEYVIRHNGASHLRSPASRLSWVQFLLLDVVFIIAVVVVIILFLISRLLSHFTPVRKMKKIHETKNKKL